MEIANSYEDARRAAAYAALEFPGTYYLAYRDLPRIIRTHARGPKAIDFGCGAGRSTRFLRRLGFETVGADISPDMIGKAAQIDPGGDYRLARSPDLGEFDSGSYDLALSVFTFDNIPTRDLKVAALSALRRLIRDDGIIVNLVSSPEIYTHEWASFSTKDYPENRLARSGDVVRCVITDIEDRRPVEDVIWPDEEYRKVYADSGLEIVQVERPLADGTEPYAWINETTIAPWVVYVLRKT